MAIKYAIKYAKPKLFSKRASTFLICLGIATLMWLVHSLNRNYKYTISIPVTFSNLPSTKVIVGELPEKLQFDIKASGLKLFLLWLRHDYKQLVIDFNNLKRNAKSQSFAISTGNYSLSSSINFDVEVIKVRPDTLYFNLKKNYSKYVYVKPKLDFVFDDGYVLSEKPTISPNRILISGDSIEVVKIDSIETQLLSLRYLKSNYATELPINTKKRNLSYHPDKISINIVIDKVVEKIIILPIQMVNVPNNIHLKLFPNTVSIKCLVLSADYDRLLEKDFKAIVNYSTLSKNKGKVDVVIIPPKVRLLSKSCEEVEYLIYK